MFLKRATGSLPNNPHFNKWPWFIASLFLEISISKLSIKPHTHTLVCMHAFPHRHTCKDGEAGSVVQNVWPIQCSSVLQVEQFNSKLQMSRFCFKKCYWFDLILFNTFYSLLSVHSYKDFIFSSEDELSLLCTDIQTSSDTKHLHKNNCRWQKAIRRVFDSSLSLSLSLSLSHPDITVLADCTLKKKVASFH